MVTYGALAHQIKGVSETDAMTIHMITFSHSIFTNYYRC